MEKEPINSANESKVNFAKVFTLTLYVLLSCILISAIAGICWEALIYIMK